ncbi:hypothetical protein [uncultured Eudoraea sp.]|uniref:hypothetical protein n=1 Tax=uncultured Eudoraea sp. TaxID=1035614 RepID=UPI00261CC9F3|nr:hypothetical protein [uncultured Eudoraea sp.]
MRTLKDQIKSISLFMATLILFQSCATYKTPSTLEQAVREQKEVKIVTVDDNAYKYKYIVYEDGQFYGVKDNPGEDVRFPINVEEVEEVLMKKKLPWWAWALIGYLVIMASIGLYYVATDDSF